MCEVCGREHFAVAEGGDIDVSLRRIDERIGASMNLVVNSLGHVPTPNVYVPTRQRSNCTPETSTATSGWWPR